MMDSLRESIAENLAALAVCAAHDLNGDRRWERFFEGADTLRWIEENGYDADADDMDELAARMEAAETALQEIDELCERQKSRETALTPAGFRDAVRDVITALN